MTTNAIEASNTYRLALEHFLADLPGYSTWQQTLLKGRWNNIAPKISNVRDLLVLCDNAFAQTDDTSTTLWQASLLVSILRPCTEMTFFTLPKVVNIEHVMHSQYLAELDTMQLIPALRIFVCKLLTHNYAILAERNNSTEQTVIIPQYNALAIRLLADNAIPHDIRASLARAYPVSTHTPQAVSSDTHALLPYDALYTARDVAPVYKDIVTRRLWGFLSKLSGASMRIQTIAYANIVQKLCNAGDCHYYVRNSDLLLLHVSYLVALPARAAGTLFWSHLIPDIYTILSSDRRYHEIRKAFACYVLEEGSLLINSQETLATALDMNREIFVGDEYAEYNRNITHNVDAYTQKPSNGVYVNIEV